MINALQGAKKRLRRSTLKKHSNSGKKNEATSKRTKSQGPVQRDTKEVLAELVGKLKERRKSWIRKTRQQRAPEKSIRAMSFAPISTV
jgi:thiamine pyrophosphate-dependent acetolactate synthase large subunit-like protein